MAALTLNLPGGSRARDAQPNIVAFVFLLAPLLAGLLATISAGNAVPLIAGAIVGVIDMQSPKIARQWERAIVLRLGKYHAMRGPGLFFVLAFVDTIASWIDQRVIAHRFSAGHT